MKKFWENYKYTIMTILVLVIMVVAFWEYMVEFAPLFKKPQLLKEMILSYGGYSYLAFIALQVVQIIFFFIPGEFVQMLGGYIFGSIPAFIYSIIGITIGSAITFMVARLLGKKSIEKIVFKNDKWLFKKLDELKKNPKKLKELVFIMYLLPGVPKDILGYICGVTPLSLKEFLLISVIARMPALFLSIFFGHKFSRENIVMLVIIAVIAGIVIFLSILKGKKFISEYGSKDRK